MAPQISNQMQQQQMSQMAGLQNQMANQMNPQVNQMNIQNQMSQQIPNQIPPNMNPQMAQQLANPVQTQMISQMHLQQRNPNAQSFPGPRNPTPTQYLTQSPTQGSVQSPAGSGGPMAGNQMVASPALVPSPSPQVSMMGGPQRSVGMAPSPSSSLNTPGQAVPTPSPMGMQEEQAYREKVRQLSKYIEPLRKMIARMGNDGERKLRSFRYQRIVLIYILF